VRELAGPGLSWFVDALKYSLATLAPRQEKGGYRMMQCKFAFWYIFYGSAIDQGN
jgi:hypothetical protein